MRGVIELHQRQFDFGVPAIAAPLVPFAPEGGIDVVGITAQCIQQLALASGLVVCDSTFDQMAGAVQLVPIAQIPPAHLGLGDDEMGVEITIWLLGVDDLISQLVNQCFQGRIGVRGERIARRLDPLRRVGISKDQDNRRRHRSFEVQIERADTACCFTLPVDMRNGDCAIYLDALRPKHVIEGNVGKWDRFKLTLDGWHRLSFPPQVPGSRS